jgi:hypothetical protein
VSIYVEILIHGPVDDLWEKLQEPKLHQRWDLRFSEIDYLPCQPGEAQKFLYATRIGAGMRIVGAGESTGERDNRVGERTSALRCLTSNSRRRDTPQVFTVSYINRLPFFAGARGWPAAVAKGWQISGTTLFQSGVAYHFHTGSDAPDYGNVDGNTQDRPNILNPSLPGKSLDNPDRSRRC